jgi:uncharacterized protein
MAISMYQASVPVLMRGLNNLAGILDKGAAYAATKKIDPAVLISGRLFPDMLPLVKQVQIASDNAKGGAARLAGLDPPRFADDEASFAELAARIQKTVAYLGTFKPEQIDGSEGRTVTLALPSKTLTFSGMQYLLNFLLPNFYFHVTTAYNILRHNGVEIGKQDFIGKP